MRYICENAHRFIHTAKHIIQDDKATSEIPCCPICLTYIYDVLDETITSVVSVDLSEVDSKLKEGYVVESLYAKTATLVKRGI